MKKRMPPRDVRAFDRKVKKAIARLPQAVRRHLDNILITVQDRPSEDLLEELGFPPDEPLFGAYLGVPLPDRSVTEPPLYPDTIILFEDPLKEACATEEELLEEIRITVLHEIAHALGMTEEEIAELGYG